MDAGEKWTEPGAQPGGCFPPAGGRGDLEQAGGSGGAGTWVKRCSGSKTDGWCRKGGKMMLDFQPGTAICGHHGAGTGSGEERGVEGEGLAILSMRSPRGRKRDGRETQKGTLSQSSAGIKCRPGLHLLGREEKERPRKIQGPHPEELGYKTVG